VLARRCLRLVAGVALVLPLWHGVLPSQAASPHGGIRGSVTHGLVPLTQSISPALRHARPLASISPSMRLSVEVRLRLQHADELRRLLHGLYTPGSSDFHHFLTPRQFAARFAPSAAAERSVEQWLGGGGLRVQTRSRNGLLLTVRGTVRSIERTLHTPLARYRLGSATVIATTQHVQVPADIAPAVAGIGGLAPSVRQQPEGLARSPSRVPGPARGYSPGDLARLYDLTPSANRGLDGSGQTVALIEFAGYNPADLTVYASTFGLSPGTVEPVPVSDGTDTGGQLGGGSQAEVELDIDVVHAVAPQAHILVYEAPNSENGALAMWNKVVADDRASVISTSWGAPESVIPPDAADGFDAMNTILEEAAAQGQTVLAASGDRGAYDAAGDKDATDAQQGALSVDFPASSPWVTGVGGTTLDLGSGGGYGGETAWSDPARTPAVGSGGGVSRAYTRPDYQRDLGAAAAGTSPMRQVPDVAADADARTGYAIYTLPDEKNASAQWLLVGGTSAAAPLWAGIVALTSQDRGRRLGFLNPGLYALGARGSAAFHDITSGDNLYYSAGPGWDFTTGWGSPDAAVLIDSLRTYAAPPPPTPEPTATATPTVTPTFTPIPSATPLPTSTPAPTVTATPAPLTVSARLARPLVRRNATQTLSVEAIAGTQVQLQIRYPGGRVLSAAGRTDTVGRWRHSWLVKSRRPGTASVLLTLTLGGRHQVTALSFAIT